jgi:hypothetical protein
VSGSRDHAHEAFWEVSISARRCLVGQLDTAVRAHREGRVPRYLPQKAVWVREETVAPKEDLLCLLDYRCPGLGSRVPTLRDRLLADLRDAPSGPDSNLLTSLYLTDDEWAAEIANRTMHGVSHIGWVPDGAGGYRGQWAVLVKPNGLLGTVYMAAIRPFRHLIVWPSMLRQIEREWRKPTHEPR